MKIKFIFWSIAMIAISNSTMAQTGSGFNFFQAFYPIADDPYIAYKSSLVSQETILFEANPTMRFSLYNNILRDMANIKKNHLMGVYISFRPQLRMYTENSLPVKTPTYRILLGTQQVWKVKDRSLFAISLESGHYSNGQSGGAFTEIYDDGTPQSEAVYDTFNASTNLSELLNRKSGNFSTDLTELIFNYRINKVTRSGVPTRTHSIKFGGTLYHNYIFGIFDAGGYTPHDIELYGRLRTNYGYEFIKTVKDDKFRYALGANLEYIHNAHELIEPLRFEVFGKIYPFKGAKDLGLFVNSTWGHDNYNFRFVDSGYQFGLGISWNLFPPITIRMKAQNDD